MSRLPNLTRAKAQADAVLEWAGEGQLLRDTPGVGDDVLNDTTMQYTPPVGDEVLVYEGPCIVTELPIRGAEVRTTEGRRPTIRRVWQVSIPLDAPTPRVRDIWKVTAAQNDALVGQRLRITDVNTDAVAVYQRMFAEDEEGATPR